MEGDDLPWRGSVMCAADRTARGSHDRQAGAPGQCVSGRCCWVRTLWCVLGPRGSDIVARNLKGRSMFESPRLRSNDVRSALALLHQLHGLDKNPQQLAQTLVDGFAELFKARLVAAGELSQDIAKTSTVWSPIAAHGAADEVERHAFAGPDIAPADREPAFGI